MDAAKKWLSIPNEIREKIVKNTIEDGEYAPVLKGECKTCGRNVARVID